MIAQTSLVTHPKITDLSTLARTKAQLGVSGSTNDTLYTELIATTSEAVKSRLGWDPARAEVLDRFAGTGFDTIRLSRQPLLSFSAVEHDGTAVETDDYKVFAANEEQALLTRSLGWTGRSLAFTFPRGDALSAARSIRPLWTVQYWAGWLLPGDDFSSANLAFDGTARTLTLSSGTWPLVVAGDRITLSGASNAENSGTFTVSERTSDSVVTLATGAGIVDEAEGQTITVTVRNLPRDLERAAIVLIRDAFAAKDLATNVASEKVGPLSVTYVTGDEIAKVSPEADMILSRWERKHA